MKLVTQQNTLLVAYDNFFSECFEKSEFWMVPFSAKTLWALRLVVNSPDPWGTIFCVLGGPLFTKPIVVISKTCSAAPTNIVLY